MASDTEVVEVTETPPPASPTVDRTPRAPVWLRVGLPLLLVLVSGGLRFADLDHPDRQYFDEVYYAEDASDYLTLGVEGGRAVHPMVGKWLIAAGIVVGGDGSFGWRLASAVAGTLTVLGLYLAGLRLFRRRGIAALAALLLSVDGIAFTASRIAMLDVFLGLFVVGGFWLLLIDRDRLWSSAPAATRSHERGAILAASTPLLPRWRMAAGLVLGLAVSTKWSALLAIGAAGLFVFGSEYAWRNRVAGRVLAGWWRPLVSAFLTLILVPLVLYVATYASWFANYENTQPGIQRCGEDATECVASAGDIFGDWLGEQGANVRFHRDLEAEHRYRAEAWTWPLLSRPVAYYYESCKTDRAEDAEPCVVEEGDVEEILGIGNPAVWWVALGLGYPMIAVGMWRRDWRAWTIVVFLLGQFVPWLIAPRPLFLFYTVPVVPFVALSLAYAADRLGRRVGLRWLPGVIAGVAVAGFLFWWPIFVGAPISEGAWRLRILFNSWI
jgi:dolichyl-phosphate-mannose--protein O-mannosyl transferase